MTEQEANNQGFVHNGGYGNFTSNTAAVPALSLRATPDSTKPVFVVEGKEIEPAALSGLDPKNIESINVLKGTSATKKYGVKGVSGVVEIKLKNGGQSLLNDWLHNEAAFRRRLGVKDGDELLSFSLTRANGDERETVAVNGYDANTLKKFLSHLQPGDVFTAEKILVKRNGETIKLPSVVQKF